MTHALRLTLLLASSLFPTMAVAEAGIPATFCREESCPCGTATCTCGQVCDGYHLVCLGAQAGFCTADSQCTASCDAFICEGNVCVRGPRRDGQLPPVAPPVAPPVGCGCSGSGGAAAVASLLLAVALNGSRRRC